jgi:hypothetical protein
MRDYLLEKYPDKIEYFDICTRLGDLDTESYWCYLKDKLATDLYAEETQEFVGVFKKNQNGYKLATETVPYPSEDELLHYVKELHVEDIEDLKKTKWQLLAEAYINGK